MFAAHRTRFALGAGHRGGLCDASTAGWGLIVLSAQQ